MTNRKPLGLVDKWQTLQHWVCVYPRLTRSALLVLARLLDRQNPKTGRCDPSAIGIKEETHQCERSVRGAIKELVKRGAIIRYQASKRARNQYVIFSIVELAEQRKLMELKAQRNRQMNLQPIAETPAGICRKNMQRTAPETIKETKKKKENAEKQTGMCRAVQKILNSNAKPELKFEEFEKMMGKAFNQEGSGYMALMELPLDLIEETCDEVRAGKMSITKAAAKLLSQYHELDTSA